MAVTTSTHPEQETILKSMAALTDFNAMAAKEKQKLSIIEAIDLEYIKGVSAPPYADSGVTDPFDEKIARKWVDEVVMKFPRGPPADCRRRPLAQVTITDVPVTYNDDNTFRVRVYVPAVQDTQQPSGKAALIMYHGGGWIHGYPEVDEDLAIFFASELRAVVVNVDYRLSPEHQFPLPLNDCHHAVQWTLDHAHEYGIDTSRVGLWGCSAGGNLAAAVALRDADEHAESRIRHVNLVVPATCHPDLYTDVLRAEESSIAKFDEGLGSAAIAILLGKYAGDKSRDPHVSVMSGPVPANHPPVHVTVAGRDFLRDEGIAYALRLRDVGIDSQLDVVPGVPHGLIFPPTTPVARQFFKNQARVLDYALNSV